MIPVWVIALVAVLGAVCLALPLHIGMTGICLLLLAAVLLALRILKKKNAPEHWSRLLTGLTAAGMAVIFGAMGYIAVQGQDSIMAQDETPAFIVVLGAQVQGDQPSLTLKKRLDLALEYLTGHPQASVVVSGGQGADEGISEAECIRRNLINYGIDPERVLLEDKSTSTLTNIENSLKLLPAGAENIGIVTNDFHIFRALATARHVSVLNFSGIPASSTGYGFTHYALREFFAVGAGLIKGELSF